MVIKAEASATKILAHQERKLGPFQLFGTLSKAVKDLTHRVRLRGYARDTS